MKIISYVKNLCKAAEECGIVYVLSLFGENLNVSLPMSNRFWESSVDELNLSVRSRNGLMRASADTVGKVSELIMAEGGLGKVRNLGKKSICEIKTALLAASYEQLTETERLAFWQDFLLKNDVSLV